MFRSLVASSSVARTLLRARAPLQRAPARTMGGGSGGGGAHADAHGKSAAAAAYDAQIPYIFGEAVRAIVFIASGFPRETRVQREAQPFLPPAPLPLFFRQPHVAGTVPHASEGWEFPYLLAVCLVTLSVAGMVMRPSTSPHEWAREEGSERLQRCGAASHCAAR